MPAVCLQRTRSSGSLPSSVDFPGNGYWHHLGQLCSRDGASLAEGQICGCFSADWYVFLRDLNFWYLKLTDAQAVGLLAMMYPILCKVRYESLHELFSHREMWKQICFSLFVNWILAPFLMVNPVTRYASFRRRHTNVSLSLPWPGLFSLTSQSFTPVLFSWALGDILR